MPIVDQDWGKLSNKRYPLGIFTCGYERRARHLADLKHVTCDRIIALDYESHGLMDYDVNRKFFEGIGAELLPVAGRAYLAGLRSAFLDLRLSDKRADIDSGIPFSLFFDVSSCSRRVLADILLLVAEEFAKEMEVTCAYALSAFSGAAKGEFPSYISEPVVGTLSGWSDDLTRPPCAVIGLGFEPGRALGCLDYLEIPEVRLMMAQGPDERFAKSVTTANRILLDEVSGESILYYDPLRPADIYEKLDSLCFGLLSRFRPVVIPLGPKIFSAVSIVLAIQVSPRLCVWRTSAGPREEIFNRKATEHISVFSARLPRPSALS
ncbi:MAG TPA: hypothetical protein VMS43_08640 [Allosphingosinicella sp.]|nr:hypothetical protein [Allosphingosinicella sp.]